MALDLDRLELRILGTLVEKEMTVPETYPLTLNALVAGCNQKSNREPHIEAEPYEVEGALRSLMDRGFVVQVERAGGRTPRYEHQIREQLAVGPAEIAILAELMNRGPQTPGELKTRAGRMHPLESPTQVESHLQALASRPVPYVERLERRPREHAARWAHLLGRGGVADAAPAEAPAALPSEEETVRPAPPTDRPTAPARPAAADPDLVARVRALEDAVADLTDRLDRLMS